MKPNRDFDGNAKKQGRCGRNAKMTTGALLAAALLGTSAFAQAPAQAPKGPQADSHRGPMRMAERFDRDGRDGWGGPRDHRGPHHRGPRHGGPRGMMSPAKLAVALSALETGIGIQPDQMAPWRKFTGSLLAFAEAMQPPRGPHGKGPGPKGPGAQGELPAAAPDQGDQAGPAGQPGAADESAAEAGQKGLFAFKMLDHFADRAINAGEKAKALKASLADLETTLTPEQIQTARGLVRSMMGDMRHDARRDDRGPRWGHGPHRPGPRGDMRMGPRGDGPQHHAPDADPMDAPQQG
ncbi:hypothetical protein LQ948_04320 [Jiella sp. MQZ9-1]|uniref:LTXXQ motif family protein n=1 Tax=Jiella flava TaxID=2816857 RepID=A0A939JUU7_9HYPH|nr:hypothetical protein [Jiella flava]MBO0661789.1 hypothetical protein [Jiella flava]MCD2470430.1 hypothetical protein [Jiella flava]